jgi:hypothetical protein
MAVERILMVHPEVDGVVSVPKTGVGQYVAQGWRLKSEADAEKKSTRKPASEES